MATPPKNVNFFVVNNSGRVMSTLWANHDTSFGDSGMQPYLQTNVQPSPTPVFLGPLTIVSRTDDFFTVMWTDPSNNLYGTPYNYKTETDIDGGDVQLVIQGATFQFFQSDEGPLDDPTEYIQYEVAGS